MDCIHTTMDYKNGKIYKLVCNETGMTYIGCTTQPLSKRLYYHKINCKYSKNCIINNALSFKIIENHNYSIVLIENYPCNNIEELKRRCRYYMETIDCVNINTHTIKSKECVTHINENIQQKVNEFVSENKEYKSQRWKAYYEKNKEKIKQKGLEYREKNRNRINERNRIYMKGYWDEKKQK